MPAWHAEQGKMPSEKGGGGTSRCSSAPRPAPAARAAGFFAGSVPEGDDGQGGEQQRGESEAPHAE